MDRDAQAHGCGRLCGDCFGRAASLAYYFSLALFPALVVTALGVHLSFRARHQARVGVDYPRLRDSRSDLARDLPAFKWYVTHFADYQKTYGAIGGVMIALLWFYFTNLAVLLGAQLDATIDRTWGVQNGTAGRRGHRAQSESKRLPC
jgi:uncharacterized BrkB/YihY/UPF0761 family membrane protein